MRREDRELKSLQECLDILSKCDVLRLGIVATDCPYVVPMNFGVDTEGQSITLWLHSAPGGLKLDLIKENPLVGFEADCSHNLVAGEKACYYTMEFESVIGCGRVSAPDDYISKRRGLRAIMHHYVPDEDFEFEESELAGVCVLRLEVDRITGKRLKTVVSSV